MAGEVLIIGIGGVTCGGKTTLSSQLAQVLPKSRVISQDDYFLPVDDPRHVWIEDLQHINFDVLSSLDMEKMHRDIIEIIEKKRVIHIPETTSSAPFIQNGKDIKAHVFQLVKDLNVEFVIVEGFSIFNYKPVAQLCQLKYYFTLEKGECCRRRSMRVYEPPDCPGYFENCVWPEHLQQLHEVKTGIENVKYFNEHTENVLDHVLGDIINCVGQKY